MTRVSGSDIVRKKGRTDAEDAAACDDRVMAVPSTEAHWLLVTVQAHRLCSRLLRYNLGLLGCCVRATINPHGIKRSTVRKILGV